MEEIEKPASTEPCETPVSPEPCGEADAEIAVEPEATDSEVKEETEDSSEKAPDIEALIAEAEQRGYLRGRNERIEELMKTPGQLERDNSGSPADINIETVDILQRERISIWDL